MIPWMLQNAHTGCYLHIATGIPMAGATASVGSSDKLSTVVSVFCQDRKRPSLINAGQRTGNNLDHFRDQLVFDVTFQMPAVSREERGSLFKGERHSNAKQLNLGRSWAALSKASKQRPQLVPLAFDGCDNAENTLAWYCTCRSCIQWARWPAKYPVQMLLWKQWK